MQRITPQKRDNIFLVCGLSWSLFAAAKLWNINQRCQQYPESCEPIKAYMTLYGCGFLFLSTFVYTLHQLTPLYVRPLHRQTLRIHQDEYDGVYRLYDRHNARQRVSKKAYPALYNYVALSREAFNCPICLHHTYKPSSIYEYFQKNSNTQSVLTCGHAFHTPCITQWMQESNNCPLCKGYISYGVILHE